MRTRSAVWALSVGLWFSPALAAPPVGDFVKDVSLVAGPGSPGTLVAFTRSAVPVVLGQVENGAAFAPVIVAAEWERGRVVALAHSGYLERGVLSQGQTALLLERLVRWAAGTPDGRAPRLGLVDGNLGARLRNNGFEVVQLADVMPESLKRVDCVLLGGRDLSQAEIESLNLFVRRGGGLVAAQTGWGWQQIAARGGPAPDMRTNALNRLLLDAGIGWTDEIVDETAPDGFDMNASAKAALDVMSLDGALDKLIGAAGPSRSPELRQASATASRAVRLLPETDQRVRPRLRALLNEHAKELTPTEKTPLRSDRPLLRMLMSVQRDDLKSLPAERVPAHPASASFPGAVSADAPRVSRTMTLPATFRGWQSTGLYAAPGEVVTITRRPDGEGPWTVRIGVHTDTLWHLPEWKRVPEIVRVWSVPAGETKIASAFGGLISIERSKSGPVEVTIEGAVEAPRFVLGQTTREQWEALRRAPAPWGEIETPSIVISAPSTALRAIDDPTALAQVWQSVLDHAADLRAIPRQRGVGERIVPDVQISAGYMHSGYPIMTHLDVVSALTQVQLLSKGEDASWGFFHELGHNHQDGLWTFDGTVEVTCNLWSLYLMEKIAGKPVGTGHDALEPREKREQRMRKHLGTGAKFERWKADPFLALEMYIQIREEFGWEPFKKVFAEYDALAEKDRPRTDVEKHEQWMVRMSRATGRNLGPFFERWGVPTGEAARASIADLPEWMPAGMPR